MGNICRSPTAEVVLRTKAKERDIPLIVDSAGTLGYHQARSRIRALGRPVKRGAIGLMG